MDYGISDTSASHYYTQISDSNHDGSDDTFEVNNDLAHEPSLLVQLNDRRPAQEVAEDPFEGALLTHGGDVFKWHDGGLVSLKGSTYADSVHIKEISGTDSSGQPFRGLQVRLDGQELAVEQRANSSVPGGPPERKLFGKNGGEPDPNIGYDMGGNRIDLLREQTNAMLAQLAIDFPLPEYPKIATTDANGDHLEDGATVLVRDPQTTHPAAAPLTKDNTTVKLDDARSDAAIMKNPFDGTTVTYGPSSWQWTRNKLVADASNPASTPDITVRIKKDEGLHSETMTVSTPSANITINQNTAYLNVRRFTSDPPDTKYVVERQIDARPLDHTSTFPFSSHSFGELDPSAGGLMWEKAKAVIPDNLLNFFTPKK